MKKTAYLLLCFIALAACKTKKGTTVPQKTIEQTTIDDFASLITLQRHDLQEKALKNLGTPTKTTEKEGDTYSFFTAYYDDATGNRMFSYTWDKKTKAVNHIRITGDRLNNYESTKAFFKSKKIDDIKVNFLGMHKDDILKIMGTPVRVNSGNYEFVKGHVSITFICYEFHEEKCSEMYLFWNYYMK